MAEEPQSAARAEQKLPSLSIVLPCFNEEAVIRRTVSSVAEYVPSVVVRHEIVAVNDGSSDRTGEILDEMAAADPSIVVVHHPRNRGYGAALRSGFSAARCDHVFYMDSDGQFDITELPVLLRRAHEADIVTGYRRERRDPWNRRLNAFILRCFNHLVLGVKLRDVDCAFKIYRRAVFDAIVLRCDGILIDTEVFYKAKRKGFTVLEVPVTHLPRAAGSQTGSRPDVLVRVVRELPKLWR